MNKQEGQNQFDNSYHDMLSRILREGVRKVDRTGTGTLSIFGHSQKFDLSHGFPLITTKKVWLKGIIHELLWMISGSQNVKYLQDNGVNIWNDWANSEGDLGPVYGAQWRSWTTARGPILGDKAFALDKIDQIQAIIHRLRTNPWCRRIMLSAWNVGELKSMALQPCHFNAQFNVTPKDPIVGADAYAASGQREPSVPGRLNCLMNIRSWDTFLGGPFNIAQYALLTMMLAQVVGLEPGVLYICSGDTHIYLNHIDQVRLQLERTPRSPPSMIIDPGVSGIDDFKFEHFKLEGYDPHEHIKGDISV